MTNDIFCKNVILSMHCYILNLIFVNLIYLLACVSTKSHLLWLPSFSNEADFDSDLCPRHLVRSVLVNMELCAVYLRFSWHIGEVKKESLVAFVAQVWSFWCCRTFTVVLIMSDENRA